MQKTEFKIKLKQLVKLSSPYIYPETKDICIPDFKKPVAVETSFIKNWKTLSEAKMALDKVDINGLEWTYNNLEDEYSKEMMLKVVAYNIFDDVKLRFPLYYDKIWGKIDEYEQILKIDDEQINLWMDTIKIKKYDLSTIGYDLKLWLNFAGIYIDFINEQYRYRDIVKVEEGDYVIDGGACYGDTALYFASKGATKVFSFEFIDENLNVFNKNIQMNSQYQDNIVLVERPLGEISGEKLYAIVNGPGTSVSAFNKSDGLNEFQTISIDDFVEENNIEKIDFIKLDIEGSEENAIRGAVKTIRKFRPKLAICVYHKKDDLWTLPKLIKEILPEYRLYLDHHTINSSETLVYARWVNNG